MSNTIEIGRKLFRKRAAHSGKLQRHKLRHNSRRPVDGTQLGQISYPDGNLIFQFNRDQTTQNYFGYFPSKSHFC